MLRIGAAFSKCSEQLGLKPSQLASCSRDWSVVEHACSVPGLSRSPPTRCLQHSSRAEVPPLHNQIGPIRVRIFNRQTFACELTHHPQALALQTVGTGINFKESRPCLVRDWVVALRCQVCFCAASSPISAITVPCNMAFSGNCLCRNFKGSLRKSES